MKQLPLFVTNPVNIAYLTGFTGSDSRERDAYLLVTPNKTYIFTNSLYTQQVTDICRKNKTFEFVRISRAHRVTAALQEIVNPARYPRLYYEKTNLTHDEYIDLTTSLRGIMVLPAEGEIEQERQVKSDTEIKYMKQAAALTDDCYRRIPGFIKAGVTESEIAARINCFFLSHDAQPAFPPIVAFASHSCEPHYITGVNNTRLKSGDLIQLDFGARVNGYNSDMSRVILYTGRRKPKTDNHQQIKAAYNSVLKAYKLAISMLSRGVRSGTQLDRQAKASIQKDGFTPYSHSLGHSLGLDIHESPRLVAAQDHKLKPGMVFTIEPAIYIAGQFGIRIEDTYLMTGSGPRVLTKSSKTMLVI